MIKNSSSKKLIKATLDTGIVKRQAKEEVKIMSNQNNRIKNLIGVSVDNTTTLGELTHREGPGDTMNKLHLVHGSIDENDNENEHDDTELNSFKNLEK
jgi:hypothetical protein